MPGRDGTGPLRRGPMTGWGFGPCGRGLRRGFGYRGAIDPVTLTREEQRKILESEKTELEKDLKELTQKLKELK